MQSLFCTLPEINVAIQAKTSARSLSQRPDGRRRFYGRLFRESGTPFVSERSAITCMKILKSSIVVCRELKWLADAFIFDRLP
jgi:hypothetical protein